MDAIAKKARELGRAIADTPGYTEYKRYSEIINGDQHKKEVADRYAAL
ncbi:MAG: YlbF family regulator, partial [Spirochaetota bacterium]